MPWPFGCLLEALTERRSLIREQARPITWAVSGRTFPRRDDEHGDAGRCDEERKDGAPTQTEEEGDADIGHRHLHLKLTEFAAKATVAVVVDVVGGDVSGEITGRQRPTSLARFVVGARTAGTRNPSVAVKPGRTSRMGRSFLIKLRGGASGDNLGLAVRTEAGRSPSGAYRPTKISENLWLVYGPSVDQVFRSVREDIGPELATYLRGEFSRLLEVRR